MHETRAGNVIALDIRSYLFFTTGLSSVRYVPEHLVSARGNSKLSCVVCARPAFIRNQFQNWKQTSRGVRFIYSKPRFALWSLRPIIGVWQTSVSFITLATFTSSQFSETGRHLARIPSRAMGRVLLGPLRSPRNLGAILPSVWHTRGICWTRFLSDSLALIRTLGFDSKCKRKPLKQNGTSTKRKCKYCFKQKYTHFSQSTH